MEFNFVHINFHHIHLTMNHVHNMRTWAYASLVYMLVLVDPSTSRGILHLQPSYENLSSWSGTELKRPFNFNAPR